MQSINPTKSFPGAPNTTGCAYQGQEGPPALRYHRLPKLTLGRMLIFKIINPHSKSPSVLNISNHARKQTKKRTTKKTHSSILSSDKWPAGKGDLCCKPSPQNTSSLPSGMNEAPPQPGTTSRTHCRCQVYLITTLPSPPALKPSNLSPNQLGSP